MLCSIFVKGFELSCTLTFSLLLQAVQVTSLLCLRSFVSVTQKQSSLALGSASGRASWSDFWEKMSRDRRSSSVLLPSAKAMTHLCENVTLIIDCKWSGVATVGR